ncbi:hypothetical protein J6590_033385 [Homalodisca vitripennis]|nr:hypothetical protein J6590_033385 [Homalodisca vitripennis]
MTPASQLFKSSAAVRVGFPQVRSLYRHRSQSFPPVVPNSLQEFAEILQQPQYSELGRSISEDGEAYPPFRGLIGRGGKQGWSAAAYLSARMQDALSNSRRIQMDATFKVLPLQLGILLQLLTVHVEYLNYVILLCSIRDNDEKNAAGVRGGAPVLYLAVSAAVATGDCLGRLLDGYPECRSPGLASSKDSGMLFPLRPGNILHAFYSANAALKSS